MITRVVNVRFGERFDVYIGRAMSSRKSHGGFRRSPWANPFRVSRDGTLEEVLIFYRARLLSTPSLLRRLPELRGKVLGCWCAPRGGVTVADRPWVCHGQVLAELADALNEEVA